MAIQAQFVAMKQRPPTDEHFFSVSSKPPSSPSTPSHYSGASGTLNMPAHYT